MQKFTLLKGLVAPIDRANVDTDAIIPKQLLKSIGKVGFGPNLFDEWRYLDVGQDRRHARLDAEGQTQPALINGHLNTQQTQARRFLHHLHPHHAFALPALRLWANPLLRQLSRQVKYLVFAGWRVFFVVDAHGWRQFFRISSLAALTSS